MLWRRSVGIEPHGALDRRRGVAGAAEQRGVVAGKAVRQPQARVHRQRLLEGARRLLELAGGGVQHALRASGKGMPRGQRQGQRRRLAPEVGGDGGGLRIAPPRIADQILASARQPDQRLDIARVARQRGEKPLLGLDAELGPGHPAQRRPGVGQTFVDPELGCGGGGAAAGFLQQQQVQLARDAPGDLGLDGGEVFRAELVAAGPQILGRRRVGDPHVDPQHAGAAALGTAGDKVCQTALGGRRGMARDPSLLGQRLEGEAAATAQQVGDEVVGKGVHQILLLGIAGQIAQRRHRHGNARQQAGPLQPGRPRARGHRRFTTMDRDGAPRHIARGPGVRCGKPAARRGAPRRLLPGARRRRGQSRWPVPGSRHRGRPQARA